MHSIGPHPTSVQDARDAWNCQCHTALAHSSQIIKFRESFLPWLHSHQNCGLDTYINTL
jgi:hypothetical protein